MLACAHVHNVAHATTNNTIITKSAKTKTKSEVSSFN